MLIHLDLRSNASNAEVESSSLSRTTILFLLLILLFSAKFFFLSHFFSPCKTDFYFLEFFFLGLIRFLNPMVGFTKNLISTVFFVPFKLAADQ